MKNTFKISRQISHSDYHLTEYKIIYISGKACFVLVSTNTLMVRKASMLIKFNIIYTCEKT